MIYFSVYNGYYIEPAGAGSEAVFNQIKLCYTGKGTLFAAVDPEERMPEGGGLRGLYFNENNRVVGIPGNAVYFTDMDLKIPCKDCIAFFFKVFDCLIFGSSAFGPRTEAVALASPGIGTFAGNG
jgi:hypothetical protein